MRIPYLAAVATLALVACQKTADTNSNMAMTNDMSMNSDMSTTTTTTSNDMSMTNVMSGNSMAGAKSADKAFLMKAVKGDNSEVAAGKMAAAQGMSQKTKDFGTMLVTDHGAHKDKVAAMLTAAGGTVSDSPTVEGIATQNLLKAKSGAAFDAAFKKAMIADHNKDIAEYTKQAASSDAATAQLAKDTLPTLKKHLAAAQAL